MFGGTGNVLEARLAGGAPAARGLRFHAERWTRRAPFRFRVEAETGGAGKERELRDSIIGLFGDRMGGEPREFLLDPADLAAIDIAEADKKAEFSVGKAAR